MTNSRKCHLVTWGTICSPKEEEGLGFRDLRTLNKAYMLKLGWQLLEHPTKLWVSIMKTKYGCGPMAMPKVCHHHNSSRTWCGIVSGWHLIQNNIQWIIRSRQIVWFWKDHWLPGSSPLHDILSSQISVDEQDFTVSYYATDGMWDWDQLCRYILEDVDCDN